MPHDSKTLLELRILDAASVSDSGINNLELNCGYLYHSIRFGCEFKQPLPQNKILLKSKPPPVSTGLNLVAFHKQLYANFYKKSGRGVSVCVYKYIYIYTMYVCVHIHMYTSACIYTYFYH